MSDLTSDRWSYRNPEDRYHADPVFHALVDMVYSFLEKDGARLYTPTELREACMLAASMYEARHIRPIIIDDKDRFVDCHDFMGGLADACAFCDRSFFDPIHRNGKPSL